MAPVTITQFSQLAIAPPLLQAIEEIGYESPSPIQVESIPPLLEGRDLLGQAQTGTGKTAAFALPVLSRLNLDLNMPQVLVLAPTRELALQVAEAMQTYARHLKGFHIVPLYGGQSMDTQLRQLRRGVHVVVGTPGRILDHLRRKTLKLSALSTVVLDEADEMLRMGFIDDVDEILQHTPTEKQVALFSATMPEAIKRIAQRHLRQPVEIKIASKTATVATISQRYWQVTDINKLDALTRMLEVEDFDAMLVFVRTKLATDELSEKLEARGYSCAALSGDVKQAVREKIVERLKSGSLDIVVATDVAARGLDVERISHVVNYDIPYDTETYIHRIGRTGRAGRKGNAILLISPRERRMLRTIERATRQPIEPMQLPSSEDISDRRITQFKKIVTDTIESQDLFFFEELIARYQQEQDLSLSEIAAALAFLLQKERPLSPKELAKAEQPKGGKEKDRDRADRRTERRDARENVPDIPMQRFRIEVGSEHGAQPKHIVGAIANEAGLDSRYIHQIQIFEDFSVVTLPEGMPKEVFKHLQKVWICGQQLQIGPFSDSDRSDDKRHKAKKTDKPGKEEQKRTRKRASSVAP
ncbi:DEAD/DEAH box helicase [Altericista sp. CCNU0014]|uniref:DEAD/DEAH box helicase n=1 Tax=Altericista sp. CCNU0014 TaxID=3082949 RepID=UPI00384F8F85